MNYIPAIEATLTQCSALRRCSGPCCSRPASYTATHHGETRHLCTQCAAPWRRSYLPAARPGTTATVRIRFEALTTEGHV